MAAAMDGLMQHIDALPGVAQPVCLPPGTGLIECDWTPGYTLQVPETWTSGIYLAQLTNRARFQNYIYLSYVMTVEAQICCISKA